MGLIVANVENQKSAGSTLQSITDDIKFTFVAHALHLNVFVLRDSKTIILLIEITLFPQLIDHLYQSPQSRDFQ